MLREGFEILKKYKIPIAKYWVNEVPKKIEFPVVVKADVLHKTEKDAVRTNINSLDELKKVFEEFKKKFKGKDIVIQEQIRGKYLELIVGAKRDKIFDYYILVGFGGIFAEIYKDYVILVPDFNFSDLKEIIKETSIKKFIKGYRGYKIDLKQLYNILKKFCKIMENENLEEIEVNPFFVRDKEFLAVDVRFLKSK